MSLIPVYRSRPSALHSARAGAGAGYCAALALTGALFLHPLVLSAALAAVVLAGIAAGVGVVTLLSGNLAIGFGAGVAVLLVLRGLAALGHRPAPA